MRQRILFVNYPDAYVIASKDNEENIATVKNECDKTNDQKVTQMIFSLRSEDT